MASHRQEETAVPAAHPRGAGARLRRWVAFLALPALVSVAHGEDSPAAAQPALASLPSFLFQPFYASNQGAVYGVYEARHADLVLVAGGFDAGFQSGMVCRVVGEESDIGEIMLVEVRKNCAAGLILQLEPGKVIRPGDAVRIKTVTF